MSQASRAVLLACLIAVLTALAGCSDVATSQNDQQAVLSYEERIGALNAAAATTPATTPKSLQALVRRYRAVKAPAVMRSAHQRLVRALAAQARAARSGLAAAGRGDRRGVSTAQATLRRQQRAAERALRQITDRASRCRAALPACSPPARDP